MEQGIKFIDLFNYEEYKGEENNEPSMTVPDETMSIREILSRYSRGLPIDGGRTPIYDEDDNFPDLKTLDLAEQEDLLIKVREQIKEYQNSQEQQNAEDVTQKEKEG